MQARTEGLSLRTVREIVVLVIESWVINDGSPVPVSSETVLEALRSRINSGRLETWLTSSSGRSLAFVTNTERAMVMLLEEEGDPGEHALLATGPWGRGRAGYAVAGALPAVRT